MWELIWKDWEKSLNSMVETMLIWHHSISQCRTQSQYYIATYGWCSSAPTYWNELASPFIFIEINSKRVISLRARIFYFHKKHLVLWNRKSIIITVNIYLNSPLLATTQGSSYYSSYGFLIFSSLTKFYHYERI